MKHQIMESELLMDLSDEQQELVAGGVDFAADATNFAQNVGALQSFSASTPGGSVTSSQAASNSINTAGAQLTALASDEIVNVEPVNVELGTPSPAGV